MPLIFSFFFKYIYIIYEFFGLGLGFWTFNGSSCNASINEVLLIQIQVKMCFMLSNSECQCFDNLFVLYFYTHYLIVVVVTNQSTKDFTTLASIAVK